MFSLSFIFTLFGLVLSVERPSSDATSLLGMIRNNPNALVTMFETADKTKVDTIIKLLGGLINEAKAEIGDINDADAECAKAANRAKGIWSEAIGKEAEAKAAYERSVQTCSKAEGTLLTQKRIYDAESPRLKKEMAIFQKVMAILNGLLSNDKRNLSEMDATEVSAFISLADQADPVKVKKILDLLKKLHAASSQELARIVENVAEAELYLAQCRKAQNEALGRYVAAKAATVAAKKAYDRIVGQCTVLRKEGAARKNILNGEIKTLEQVVGLLNGINA